jgi:hypothetical protein
MWRHRPNCTSCGNPADLFEAGYFLCRPCSDRMRAKLSQLVDVQRRYRATPEQVARVLRRIEEMERKEQQ